jgi:hypothetical protein
MFTRLALAVALSAVALNPPAFGAFTEAPRPKIGPYNTLECAIVKTTERYQRDDADPFYKIVVELTTAPVTMTVRHVSASGRVRTRDEQYGDARMWQTPNRNEWTWTGTLTANRQVTMRGLLWNDVSGNWYYSETLHERGAQTYTMTARCHDTGETEGM